MTPGCASSIFRRPRVLFAGLLAALLVLAAAGAVARASLPFAGSGEHLWLVLPGGEQTIAVLHRGPGDDPGLRQVKEARGRIAPRGIAADGNRLTLVYRDGTLQSLAARPGRVPESWQYDPSPGKPLPDGVTLRAFAGSARRPWALVRATDPDVLAELDGTEASADRSAEAQSADRLLTLRQGNWRRAELPDDWPGRAAAHLVVLGEGRARTPLLLAVLPDELRTWHRADGAWQGRSYPLPDGARLAVSRVDDQLALAWAQRTDGGRQISLALLRPGRIERIGEVTLPVSSGAEWGLAGGGQRLVVLAAEPARAPDQPLPRLVWAWMGFDGQLLVEPGEVELLDPSPPFWAADMILHVSVVGLAVVLLLLFWRRDPESNQVKLPETQQLAPLARRTVAALVDLAPFIALVMFIYQLDLRELLLVRWPGGSGQMGGWESMAPGLVVIGPFLVYVTVAELIFARTVGKLVAGLRVTDLRGSRPRWWQLLVRNLLKGFDLIVWLLLILVVIGPYRQRLGDLLARTIVTAPAPPPVQEEASSE
ncbi:MAG: RDD family protein [Phycisphaeraceae bacterium]